MIEAVREKFKSWYEIRKKVFGEALAKQWTRENTKRYEVISSLCEENGLTTWEQYAEWERRHIDERNRRFTKEGVIL